MKKSFLIGLLISMLIPAFGQTVIKKKYFDSNLSQLKEIITILLPDSSLHGKYQAFHRNESLSTIGYYKNNQADSLWQFYYENGNKKAEGRYKKNQQTGYWTYFYENGNLKAEGYFATNRKAKIWKFYYENGSLKSEGTYENGQKTGLWHYWYEKGPLKARTLYHDNIGDYESFYPNGNLQAKGTQTNEISTGEWFFYYESGEIHSQGSFENGVKSGNWIYYHKNGNLSATGSFSEGKKSDLWNYFYQDGKLSKEGNMAQDQQDGIWKLYFPDGKLKGKALFNKGTGTFTEYYETGKIKATGPMIKSQKHGDWIYFDQEGNEEGRANFKEGKGEYVGQYIDGTIKMKGVIEHDKKTGQWELYNQDGSLAGTYTPVYDIHQPILRNAFILEENKKQTNESLDKPDYHHQNKKIHYFSPVVNEFQGIILAGNPFRLIDHSFPISIEYYYQERLGYELEAILKRKPFFSNTKINQIQTSGISINFKQKFYHPESEIGMLYFGHQIGFAGYGHQAIKIDSTSSSIDPFETSLSANESHFYYGVFIGNRWMQRISNAGITIDFNFGIGIGNRSFTREYAPSDINESLFQDLDKKKLITPIIFTLNIGFAGPKRPSPGF